MMNKSYEQFIAIAKAINLEIVDRHAECVMKHQAQVWFQNSCMGCYGKEGWDKRLGEILRQHGIELEKFVAEVSGTHRPDEGSLFELVNGELKFKRACDCFYVARLHLHIARVLPSD